MKNSIQFLLVLLITFSSIAQSKKDKVLFTIEGEPTYVSEFSRVYKKNLDIIDKKDQKEVKEYFDLFVEYKLKLKEARNLGLHEKSKYKRELSGYKKQLSQNYLTDNNATTQLVQEAYDRMQKEVRASHILIKVALDASPKDTLAAYEKITKLRQSIIDGADFGTVAQKNSQDPSAKKNKGDLGYFSAFRMVYPFESAAFTTKVGDVSQPIRTQFGYHIVKVEDIRENPGEVTVAHILLLDNSDKATNENPAEKIKDIYTKIKSGEDFGKLAKRFSEDRSSAVNGGKLPKFGPGRIRSKKFEEVAFGLKTKGELSTPFKSEFGWHVVKLIQRHELKSFDEEKSAIERKIKKDRRSKVINDQLLKKIKNTYTIVEGKTAKEDFYNLVTPEFFKQEWRKTNDESFLNKSLFKIKETSINYDSFIDYLLKNRRGKKAETVDAKSYVNHYYTQFVNGKLLEFYESDLENVNEEFAAIYGEYRDGLLLFDLMENEVWEKAKKDTLGLENFYRNNKEDYKWKQRVDAVIASCTDKNMASKVQQLMKQGKDSDEIKKELNKDAKVNVIFSSGIFEEGNRNLPENYTFKRGVSEIIKDGTSDFIVIKANEIIAPVYKELNEVKGKAISDYQVHIEKEWIKSLKKNYKIKVNKRVYRKLEKLIK